MKLSALLKMPTKPKHWFFIGLFFVALWIPRVALFSADAFDICSGVSSAPMNHENPELSQSVIQKDTQIEVGRCGVLRAVMHSQLSIPQQPLSEITRQSQTFMGRMAAAPLATSTLPTVLHSRPTATRKIFLDFNGYTVPSTSDWFDYWPTNTVQGLSLDGDYNSFTAQENAYITEIWAGVAEDFAPFNIDVTTEDPGTAGLSRSSVRDSNFGTTAVISSDYTYSNACGCGGIAYVGVIDEINSDRTPNPYTPSFNFVSFSSGNFLTAADAAGVISHETGHNLGLGHDGNTTGDAYYSGHENGLWAPIMGTSYEHSISQWSKNEYLNGVVTSYTDIPSYDWIYDVCLDSECEDDVKVISTYNAIPLITDDYGSNFASALSLSGTSISRSGYIGGNSDIDMFKIVLTDKYKLTLTAAPIAKTPNLDIKMKIYNSSQTLLTTVDDVASRGPDGFALGVSAAVSSYALNAGTYYISIEGTGALDPLTTGYTSYGSMGQYTLTGNLVVDGNGPINLTLPTISSNPSGFAVGSTVTAVSTSGQWSGSPTPQLSLQWQRFASGSWSSISRATNSTYVLSANDAGSMVRVAVTARNTIGSATAYSLESTTIGTAPTVATSALTISGTARVNQTITLQDRSTWRATPAITPTYQWYACTTSIRASKTTSTTPLSGCTAISGETGSAYLVRAGDTRKYITVAGTGTNSYGSLVLWAKSTSAISASR